MTVTVFSKDACVQCDATYRKLDKLGIEYTVVNAEHDMVAQRFVMQRLGYQQMPVVLVHEGDWINFVPSDDNGADHWSGNRPDQLDALVKRLELIEA